MNQQSTATRHADYGIDAPGVVLRFAIFGVMLIIVAFTFLYLLHGVLTSNLRVGSVIQVRTQDILPQGLGSRLVQILRQYEPVLESGTLITVNGVVLNRLVKVYQIGLPVWFESAHCSSHSIWSVSLSPAL